MQTLLPPDINTKTHRRTRRTTDQIIVPPDTRHGRVRPSQQQQQNSTFLVERTPTSLWAAENGA